jgi:hypothetical protein
MRERARTSATARSARRETRAATVTTSFDPNTDIPDKLCHQPSNMASLMLSKHARKMGLMQRPAMLYKKIAR